MMYAIVRMGNKIRAGRMSKTVMLELSIKLANLNLVLNQKNKALKFYLLDLILCILNLY